MRYGRFGCGHDIEVAGRVVAQTLFDHRIAEQLIEPDAHLLGGSERLAPLNATQYIQQVRIVDIEDGQLAQPGQHVLGKNAVDLRQGALAAGFQAQRLEVAPGLEDRCKGVQGGGQLRRFDLQTVNTRINATGNLRSQVVALLARLLEGHFRVTANGNALLLAQPSEAEVPLLGPSGGDEQHQAVRIVEGVVFAGGLGLPDDGIG